MKTNTDNTNITWWGRIEAIKKSLCIKYSSFSKIEVINTQIKKSLKNKFQSYWMKLLNEEKIGDDGKDHNKLRMKGCFQMELYIDFVPNRAQRADISRLRISSSCLAIETMRYQRPYVPADQRYCRYADHWNNMRLSCRASLIMSTTS